MACDVGLWRRHGGRLQELPHRIINQPISPIRQRINTRLHTTFPRANCSWNNASLACVLRLLLSAGRGIFGLHTAFLWAKALSVTSANLITRSQYRSQLQCIGYDNIQIVDISVHDFRGFIAFSSGRGFLWATFARMLRMWWKMGGRYV